MKNNLAIIYLEYDNIKYPDAFEYLQVALRKFKNSNIKIIRVDNRIIDNYIEKIDDNTIKINGNDELREFSGYQRGLDYLKENYIKYDAILFVNDSFLVYGKHYIDCVLKQKNLAKTIRENAIIGIIDTIKNSDITLDGYDVSSWVRTNCFFVSKNIINDINNVCPATHTLLNKCIDFGPSGNYFKGIAPMSANFKNHLIKWLTKDWHSFFEPKKNWHLFREKGLAIFNEKLLTAKIREKGYNARCCRDFELKLKSAIVKISLKLKK
ncbi:MAG: hypothetical protein PHV68_03565 [Candidatus Gastranaerophilales bacterium]|nr:hypothetical protein [Candidatus Gastranaerophilales bacterium]